MKKPLLFSLLLIVFSNLFAQGNLKKIKTDSSEIRIFKKNGLEMISEIYKDKDSVYSRVNYNSSLIKMEGWETKRGRKIGIWKEYTESGELMYSWNHDDNICTINQDLYPYHSLLAKAKLLADSIIQNTYSKEFFEQNVIFNYDCSAFYGFYKMYPDGKRWIDQYVGAWTEPMSAEPNSFLFWYDVVYSNNPCVISSIGIHLDNNGSFIAHSDQNIYGFEKLKPNSSRNFTISYNQAIQTIKENGYAISDTIVHSTFLEWESFYKPQFYNGQFIYCIAIKVHNTNQKQTEPNKWSKFEEKYHVFIFNPWTSELIKMRKMKTITEWGKAGRKYTTTKLLPDE